MEIFKEYLLNNVYSICISESLYRFRAAERSVKIGNTPVQRSSTEVVCNTS